MARRTVEAEADLRLPLATVLAFIRISTDARVHEHPREPAAVITIIEALLERPNVSLAGPGDRHWRVLAATADAGQARGAHLMDAHLAALAIEHGATLATTDRSLARYRGLRTVDPAA